MYIGLVCGRYQQVMIKLRAWGQCGHCGKMLMKLLPSDQQPCILRVDWKSGYSTIIPDPTYKDLTGSSEAVEQPLGPVLYTHIFPGRVNLQRVLCARVSMEYRHGHTLNTPASPLPPAVLPDSLLSSQERRRGC